MTGGTRRPLRIQLLGGFAVAGAAPVDDATWRLRRARALVKLLALSPGHRLHREQVIDALWPEREPVSPSNNLRQTIFAARRALDSAGDDGAARLRLDGDAVVLGSENLRIDVDEYEELAARAEREATILACEAATGRYAELLPDDRFEDWTQTRRLALRERNLALLVGLAALHEQAGEQALRALAPAIDVVGPMPYAAIQRCSTPVRRTGPATTGGPPTATS